MQELNRRKENCHRLSAQTGQQMNCTQKLQRVRCCGRVLSEQEVGDGLLRKKPGQGKRRANGQGRGQGMAKGQGRGQGMAKSQDQQY